MPQQFSADDVFGCFRDRQPVLPEQARAARNEGLYTPPSTQGTLIFPMTGGGVNWGGAAFDPVNQILYANTSCAIHIVKLMPRARGGRFQAAARARFRPAARRAVRDDARGRDVAARTAVQQAALGRDGRGRSEGRQDSLALDRSAPRRIARRSGIAFHWGTPLVNGVAITAGGLVFTGAMDAYLRAFDAEVRRRAVAGPAAGARRRQSHDLSVEGRAICRDRAPAVIPRSAPRSATAWWRFACARPGEAPSLWSRTIDRPGGRFASGAIAARRGAGVDRDRAVALAASAERQCVRCDLVERDADPPVVAPDRMAAARETIGGRSPA